MGGGPLGGPPGKLPGPPGPGGAPLAPPSPVVAAKKRAELRRQLRLAQRLKTMTLSAVVLLLLAAYPMFLAARQVSLDPVFVGLNSLELPDWAAGKATDASGGSRWCIGRCRFRERTWQSARPPDETLAAYQSALHDAGWRPRLTGICPTAQDGVVTCWYHDEYMLDMWVRAPICNTPPVRPTLAPTRTPARTSPSPGAEVTTPPAEAPSACPGALVTVKVFNSVGYAPGE
jgi:hypothetical protein